METIKYIFGKSEYVDGIGEVYPILMEDYDEFMECSNVLAYRIEHFPEKYHKDYKLLDLVTYGVSEGMYEQLEKLFSMVLKKNVHFVVNDDNLNLYAYIVDEENIENIESIEDLSVVTRDNYDELRRVIMKQNLIFEQKIYKNELVRKFAELKLEHMRKNSANVTTEDMITSIVVNTGISYEQISKMTIYQMNSTFKRINRDKDYHVSVAYKCAGAEKINIPHFAENLNMFKNPYDDIFVTKDKLSKMNEAIGN